MEVFDDYADNYEQLHANSIKASGFKPEFFDEHKIKILVKDFSKNKKCIQKINILNFGCGIGKSESYINQYFTNVKITSVDVSYESLEKAKIRNKNFNNINFHHFKEVDKLFLPNKFDIIFVANVFHHIPSELHLKTLKFLKSQLNDSGYLYIFEHNPKNFLTRKAFETCEFDIGCQMIPNEKMMLMLEKSGYSKIKRKFILFFPKILDFLLPFEKYLHPFSLGAQYYIKAK